MIIKTNSLENYLIALCGITGVLDVEQFEKLYGSGTEEFNFKNGTIENRISMLKKDKILIQTQKESGNKMHRLTERYGVEKLRKIESILETNYELIVGKKGTRFKGPEKHKERVAENGKLLMWLNNNFMSQIFINGIKIYSNREPRIVYYSETIEDIDLPVEYIFKHKTLTDILEEIEDDKTYFFTNRFQNGNSLVTRESMENKKRVTLVEYRGRQTRGTLIRNTKVYAAYYTDRYEKPWVSDIEYQTLKELEDISMKRWGICDVGAIIYTPDELVASKLLKRQNVPGQKYKFVPEQTYDNAYIVPMFVDGLADAGLIMQEILLKEEHELILSKAILGERIAVHGRAWDGTDGINDHYILLDGNIKKTMNLKFRSDARNVLHCYSWQAEYLAKRYEEENIELKIYSADDIYNALLEKGVELL